MHAAAPPLAGSSAAPLLRDHAYDALTEWNGERAGFGAYTYVVLGRGADRLSPEVARRLDRVVAVLKRGARDAAQVSAEEAPNINLVCIPTLKAMLGNAGSPAQSYHDDLGKQLLARSPGNLFARRELVMRMQASQGPILITLPKRIADARSDTPMLLADLGSYPDDAIDDLVTGYKGDLLSDFPRLQALWRPPAVQRVALTMIRLATDAGVLAMSVLPSAQARPAPPGR